MPPPYGYQLVGTSGSSGGKKGRGREYYMEEYEEDDDGIGGGGGGGSGGGAVKKLRREGFDGYGYGGGAGIGGKTGVAHSSEKKGDGQSRVDREADNQQLLQLEEKDVVSSRDFVNLSVNVKQPLIQQCKRCELHLMSPGLKVDKA
ncbi:hypothetical protein CRG98_034333 [Punica granatum]|uniref:Uncharacterized protein n=1 Tax=Punica granatum TaxID=22663 RepID=A0A2I0IPB7_PUNGR|nr:hypothetical protein CRG98_034333 [Punica granatum]